MLRCAVAFVGSLLLVYCIGIVDIWPIPLFLILLILLALSHRRTPHAKLPPVVYIEWTSWDGRRVVFPADMMEPPAIERLIHERAGVIIYR
jgi:hypothetical protein